MGPSTGRPGRAPTAPLPSGAPAAMPTRTALSVPGRVSQDWPLHRASSFFPVHVGPGCPLATGTSLRGRNGSSFKKLARTMSNVLEGTISQYSNGQTTFRAGHVPRFDRGMALPVLFTQKSTHQRMGSRRVAGGTCPPYLGVGDAALAEGGCQGSRCQLRQRSQPGT